MKELDLRIRSPCSNQVTGLLAFEIIFVTLAAVYTASKTKDNEAGIGRKKAKAVLYIINSRVREKFEDYWLVVDALEDVKVVAEGLVTYISNSNDLCKDEE